MNHYDMAKLFGDAYANSASVQIAVYGLLSEEFDLIIQMCWEMKISLL